MKQEIVKLGEPIKITTVSQEARKGFRAHPRAHPAHEPNLDHLDQLSYLSRERTHGELKMPRVSRHAV